MSLARLPQKLLLFALLFSAVDGVWLAQSVDSWLGFLPALLAFSGFAAGLWGWGRFSALRLGYGGLAEGALFSTLAAVVPAFLLGHSGALGNTGRILALAYLVVGIFLARMSWRRPRLNWPMVLLGAVVLFRFFNAYLPSGHGDPLIYHLLGPRLWVQQGMVTLHPDLPNALLAGAWEYFYLWPQLIFNAGGEIHSLVLAQIYSQWIHLLWGWLGIPLVADAMLFRGSERSHQRYFVFFSLLFVSSLQWTGALAKNDCGVACWALGAMLFWSRGLSTEGRARDFMLAGTFAGLAVAGKLNAAIFLLPALLAYWLMCLREVSVANQIKGGLASAVFGAFTVGLFFFRNWKETANPFFPLLHSVFPSPWVSQSWADNFASMNPGSAFSPHTLGARIMALPRENPLMLGWLLLPVLYFRAEGRAYLRLRAPWIAVALASLLLFGLAFGGSLEMRHLGAGLILLTAIGSMAAAEAVDLLKSARARRWAGRLLIVVLLACSRLPLHLIWKSPGIAPGVSYLSTHTAGDAKAWLREHAGREELIAVMADNETYYLSGQKVTVLTERPDIDRATYGVKDFAGFMRGLCSTSRATYLLDARESMGMAPRFPDRDLSSALLFRGVASNVYDLGKLEALAYREGAACASASR